MKTFIVTDKDFRVTRIDVSTEPPALEFEEVCTEYEGEVPDLALYRNKAIFFIDGQFEFRERLTLAEARALRRAYVNEAWELANLDTFEFAGKRIRCDNASRQLMDAINGVVSTTSSLPDSFALAWKAVDNSYVSIPDVETWKEFYSNLATLGIENFNKAQTLKEMIDTASHESLPNIVW